METFPCPKCGVESPFKLTPEMQHYGSIRCPTHGHLWISKPSELKTVRRKVNSDLFDLVPESMRDYCWNCLRQRSFLKSLRPAVVLQAHHIVEVQHGGLDERDNIQIVCAECHSAIHRIRETFNRYKIYTESP